jgi:hypothetical protein
MFSDMGISSLTGERVGGLSLVGVGNEGSYVIFGESVVGSGGAYGQIGCWVQGTGFTGPYSETFYDTGTVEQMISYSAVATFGSGGGVIDLYCKKVAGNSNPTVQKPRLTVIKVGAIR